MERVLLVLFYQPVAYSDTASYRRLADRVLQGFANYDGTRTPGYPVFLALTGTDQRAWLVQLFLGLITTLLLFYLGWKLTGQAWFGGAIGLAHTLNLGQLFFESDLLTESLSAFLVILAMVGVFVWLKHPRRRTVWMAFLIGLASTLALLVRPLFIYLPFFLLAFLWVESRLPGASRQRTEQVNPKTETGTHSPHPILFGISLMLPVMLLLGGWVLYIHKEFNQWSLTTMTGYHLVQHTGNFFEYVPDEYASIRDTYIKYRDAHIAQYGTQANTIWDAIPEMSKVSGYSFYGLSRVLTSISIQLILKHPFLFLKSAASGWWMFWRPPVYWSAEALQLPSLVGAVKLAILAERLLLFLANLFFIIASLYFAILEAVSMFRHRSSWISSSSLNPSLYRYMWMLLAMIWIASVLQTLLDHGDNPRFLVPLQSLVVLWVGLFVYSLFTARRRLLPPAPLS